LYQSLFTLIILAPKYQSTFASVNFCTSQFLHQSIFAPIILAPIIYCDGPVRGGGRVQSFGAMIEDGPMEEDGSTVGVQTPVASSREKKACGICDRKFSSQSNLNRHVETNSKPTRILQHIRGYAIFSAGGGIGPVQAVPRHLASPLCNPRPPCARNTCSPPRLIAYVHKRIGLSERLGRPAEVGILLPNNQRQCRTCLRLVLLTVPRVAALTSGFRMDSNSTST
jgi:hypothetical protein